MALSRTTAQPVPDARVLHLALSGTPPQVVFSRGGVDGESWYRIRLVFPDAVQSVGTVFAVPPEALVLQRGPLSRVLVAQQVGLDAEPGVRALLAGVQDDAQALADALAGRRRSIGDPAREVYRLIRELRPFQMRDWDKLISLKHGANFSVPGAGKTTVAYAIHAALVNAGRAAKLLVVAPYSAFTAWEEDAGAVLEPAPRITRWRPGTHPSGDVVLVAYPQLMAAAAHLVAWMTTNPVHLVVDEAHRAKRGTLGQWGSVLMSLAPFAVRRDLLTGTPAPNHPRDLAALLDILWPGVSASRQIPPAALVPDPPAAAMGLVQAAIEPLYVRTNKDELDLPPVRIVREKVPLGDLQAQIYAALRNQYAGSLTLDANDQGALAMMGEVTVYLLQAASSPRLLADAIGPRAYRFPPLAIPEGSRLAGLIETYADHEVPAKVQVACRIVHENATAGRKTLVWSNFPANLRDLEAQLAALEPAVIYGGVPTDPEAPRNRDGELARFKHDPACLVLLANPAAMSEGVSLHRVCHDAVYVDRTFNAGQYLQSLDRIHRLGMDVGTETRVTLLVADNTIDTRVDSRVELKTRRLSRILGDPALAAMALPDDDDPGGFYDEAADLAEVLAHLASGLPNSSDSA